MKIQNTKTLFLSLVGVGALYFSQVAVAVPVELKMTNQRQEALQCVPTGASMMLSSKGWNYPPRQIKLLSLNKPYYGPTTPFNYFTETNYGQLKTALNQIGQKWSTVTFKNDAVGFDTGLNKIKDSINRGYPVLLGITICRGVGHAVVIKGYDDDKKYVIVGDPGDGQTKQWTYAELQNRWNLTYTRINLRSCMFMF